MPCPCADQYPGRACLACGYRNTPGHDRPGHRGFVQVIDPDGASWVCTCCVGALVMNAGEWGTARVTVLLAGRTPVARSTA